jgi:hypothetical protein
MGVERETACFYCAALDRAEKTTEAMATSRSSVETRHDANTRVLAL